MSQSEREGERVRGVGEEGEREGERERRERERGYSQTFFNVSGNTSPVSLGVYLESNDCMRGVDISTQTNSRRASKHRVGCFLQACFVQTFIPASLPPLRWNNTRAGGKRSSS